MAYTARDHHTLVILGISWCQIWITTRTCLMDLCRHPSPEQWVFSSKDQFWRAGFSAVWSAVHVHAGVFWVASFAVKVALLLFRAFIQWNLRALRGVGSSRGGKAEINVCSVWHPLNRAGGFVGGSPGLWLWDNVWWNDANAVFVVTGTDVNFLAWTLHLLRKMKGWKQNCWSCLSVRWKD